ncbi:MAG: tetratricopeptide repeat protein, partial [Terriglobia bacterium]
MKSSKTLPVLLLIAGLFLVINGAYLAAFATPNLFYAVNSVLHPALGVAAVILLALFAVKRREQFKHLSGAALLILAAGTAIAGFGLAVMGMTSRHRTLLAAHVAFALALIAAVLVYLRSRTASAPPSPASPGIQFRTAWRWSLGVVVVFAALYCGAVGVHHFFPNQEYIVRNPKTAPLTMQQEGGGGKYFTFPSSIQTADGKPMPVSYFLTSKSCQPCHADIYRQWYSSMHHYSSFNNQWYRRSVEYMQDTVGIKPSLWCGGCHDQALALTGLMQKYPIRDIEHTPAGQNGLGCISCHSVVHVASTMGQADMVVQYPGLAKYVASRTRAMRLLTYYQVKLDPKAHASVFFKPFHYQRAQQAEFCSACHKVHMDVPVNHYRWNRGFDEYDHWQASGVSGYGARSFYYPPKPENCVDCHMPLVRSTDFGNINGYVHSHRFAAANTAVPESHGDEKQLAAVEHFLKGALSVDIFALAEEPPAGSTRGETASPAAGDLRLATTFAVGEESARGMMAPVTTMAPPTKLIAPLGRVAAVLHRGETVRVEVVVRNLKVGHFFPAGTVDAYDCWLEFKARDSNGRIIFWSGKAADGGSGPVDPGAHFYRALQLDAHQNVINKRNTWFTRAVVYTHLIPPGAADTVHYRLQIPQDCGSRITITAKLNYRKFRWWYTQWAFAGVHAPGAPPIVKNYNFDDQRWAFTGTIEDVSAKFQRIPDVPTVVIAQESLSLPVAGADSGGFTQQIALNPADRTRWNDYGIGLLLQGDLKGAERAFDVVTKIDPKYADGWVNVARAMIQEGSTQAAKPLLARALKLNPKLASAHYFYALAFKAAGNYPRAYHQFA